MAEPGPTLRDYYAAERTLLAWIRTGIAMMGFGFVVARFGVFLGELRMLQLQAAPRSVGLSLWFGIGLLLFGVVVSTLSVAEYRREVQRLNAASAYGRSASRLAVWTAIALAGAGVAMSLYLVSISRSVAAAQATALPA